jgi:hypothetical protein
MHKSIIRRKLFSVEHRVSKVIYGERVNFPYLSGDGFESLCDFSAYSLRRNLINNKEISSARSIFCRSSNLEELIQNFGDAINAEILVLGNSDRDFYDFNLKLPSSIRKVYLQNSHISDSFFHTLPIGLENLRLARNGIPSLFKTSQIEKVKKYEILVGPYSPTHAERKEVQKWQAVKHKKMTFLGEYVSPRKLSRLSPQYLFVACPRGNGTDTHRFWETLYRGSIPVVKKSNWSGSLRNLNIPFIEISGWDFEEFLDVVSTQSFKSTNPREIPELWSGYWQKLLN